MDGKESPEANQSSGSVVSFGRCLPNEYLRTSVLTAVKAVASSIDPNSRQPPGLSDRPASNHVPARSTAAGKCVLRAVVIFCVEAVG